MAQNEHRNGNEIQRILATKEAAKVPITHHEAESMIRHQQRQLDELVTREFNVYAEQALKASMNLAKLARDAGADSPLQRSMEAMAHDRPLAAAMPQHSTPPCPAAPRIASLPGGLCLPPMVETPPYTTGGPYPAGTEVAGPPATGSSSVFRTSSSLANPDKGSLSVGVANGNLGGLGTYPSSGGWLFGDANMVGANILHVVSVPGGPYAVPACVQVTVDIQVGRSIAPAPYILVPGGPGSTGNGLVGLFGKAYLEVYAANPIGPAPRKISHEFLLTWRSRWGGFGGAVFPITFSLSEALGFGPGAPWVAVNIAVRLMAFRAGVNDPAGGFSGIDLRDPEEITHGLWFLQGAGGPTRLSNLTMTFCQLGFIPVEEFRS